MRAAGAAEVKCVGGARCETRYAPASTFKAPHAVIALDVGALSGPEHELPWDGKRRWVSAWNRDHTLASAIRDSVVWYFQRVAPQIGRDRMAAGLAQLDYGNQTNRGWFAGCIDGRSRVCFATVLFAAEPFDQARFRRERIATSQRLLEALGYAWPAR